MESGILYEQPLNETLRVCLRLECVFKEVEYFLHSNDYWNNRASVSGIIDLINILDRPDFKNKVIQLYIGYKEKFTKLLHHDDDVQQDKLLSVLGRIEQHLDYLQATSGKLTQEIERNEFLTSVKLRLAKTAGARSFDLPMYHFWLSQPDERRLVDLTQWFDFFVPIRRTVEFLLELIRYGTDLHDTEAPDAYYEKMLDPQVEYQLIRIQIPQGCAAYPDISVGRHRLSVHFFNLNKDERPTQVKDTLYFQLACCV